MKEKLKEESTLSLEASTELANQWITMVDSNGNGTLDFEEF